ncbi:hypothetical protein Q0M94_07410 [Deinococcus radiomollis]|uniref:hypothetical protein n=1 Tax=Deinococcus radiomollis TaxID=468916 RepID=UPI003891F871
MKRTALAFPLLLLGTAGATATPVRSLITGSGGQITTSPDTFAVSKRTSLGRTLLLGIGQGKATNNRINALGVIAFSESLTTDELDLYSKNVIRVALKCFNLRPERVPAIKAWLRLQNQTTLRTAANDFGPMTMRLQRGVLASGQYYTGVAMLRAGQPGVSPWTGYCTP